MQNLTIENRKNELNLKQYYNNFIEYLDIAPSTFISYKKNLKQFFNYLEDNNIKEPTREDIISFRDAIKREHKPTTTRAYINTIKQFFKWLSYEGIYPNIADNIKGAKITLGHKKEPLTIEQVKTLLASFKRDTTQSKRDYAIILLCICCGLRTIEVARANLEDYRIRGDFIALYIQGKGKQDKSDYVKIPHELDLAIKEYIQTRTITDNSAPLFASCSNKDYGERLAVGSISRLIKNALKKIGLNSQYITAHSLRHTTANIYLRNGGTLEETQQLLRHANITTTMIYIKELDKSKSESEQKIASLILNN